MHVRNPDPKGVFERCSLFANPDFWGQKLARPDHIRTRLPRLDEISISVRPFWKFWNGYALIWEFITLKYVPKSRPNPGRKAGGLLESGPFWPKSRVEIPTKIEVTRNSAIRHFLLLPGVLCRRGKSQALSARIEALSSSAWPTYPTGTMAVISRFTDPRTPFPPTPAHSGPGTELFT